MRVYLLIVLIVAVLAYRPIVLPADITIQGLQQGYMKLENSENTDTQVYEHTFEQPFLAVPTLAPAILSLSLIHTSMSSSFRIIAQKVTKSGWVVQWERGNGWLQVSLVYLATLRDDLMLGHSTYTPQGSQKLISIPLPRQLPNHASCISRVFLLGCASPDSSIDCGVLPKDILLNALIVKPESKSNIKNITISYLIYSPSQAGFSSQGGMVGNTKFSGSYHADLHKSIAHSHYTFLGISSLQWQKQEDLALRAEIDISLVLSLESSSEVEKLFIFYMVIGRDPSKACKKQQAPYHLAQHCFNQCPPGTVSETYSNNGKACRACSPKLHLIFEDGRCVCEQGWKMENGKCIVHVTDNNSSSDSSEALSDSGLPLLSAQQPTTELKQKIVAQFEKQMKMEQLSDKIRQLGKQQQISGSADEKEKEDTSAGSQEAMQDTGLLEQVEPPFIPPSQLERRSIASKIQQQVMRPPCPDNSYQMRFICICRPGYRQIGLNCSKITELYTTLSPRLQVKPPVSIISDCNFEAVSPPSSDLTDQFSTNSTILSNSPESNKEAQQGEEVKQAITEQPVSEESQNGKGYQKEAVSKNPALKQSIQENFESKQLNKEEKEIRKVQEKTEKEGENFGLTLEQVKSNSNQLFFSLMTDQQFKFPDKNTMENFLKVKFSRDAPPTMYCTQQPNALKHFECLCLYTSGVPNHEFQVDFSYDYEGFRGQLKANVDPLKTMAHSRHPSSRLASSRSSRSYRV